MSAGYFAYQPQGFHYDGYTHKHTSSGASSLVTDASSQCSSAGPSTPPMRPARHHARPSSSASGGSPRPRSPQDAHSPKQLYREVSFVETERDGHDTLLRALEKLDFSSIAQPSDLERINDDLKASIWAQTESPSAAAPVPSYPVATLSQSDIAFRTNVLPESSLVNNKVRDILAAKFPSLCDAPARMFGEDGKPLPPTKKEEISEAERNARKEALFLRYMGKQTQSLIKATIVLESRTAAWKRVGPSAQRDVATLPEAVDAWSLEISHQGLDLNEIGTKAKRVFELPGSRCHAACPQCTGRGLATCTSCKGEQADECFWCAGSGRDAKGHRCNRCEGSGSLACRKCSGTLLSTCKACEGSGAGQFAYMVTVKFRRVKVPPVPTQWVVFSPRPHLESVRNAATARVWDLIQRMSTTFEAKRFVPVAAEVVWDSSSTHLVQVDHALVARLSSDKTTLKPVGLSRKIPTARRYFSIPSDSDLELIELSRADFEAALHPEVPGPLPIPAHVNLISQLGLTPPASGAGTPANLSRTNSFRSLPRRIHT